MSNAILIGNGRSLAPPTIDDEAYLLDQFGKPRDQLSEEVQHQWDRELEQIRRKEARIQSLMSAPGELHLSPLLESRRLEWRIPDGAFNLAPIYDRVYVYQIPTYIRGKKGNIALPETKKKGELRQNPRGILVAAGLLALDAIRSNGMDLGHIIRHTHVNPWRLVIDYADGEEFELQVMTAGNLTGSEDLADVIRSGAMRIERDANGKHRYVDQEGNEWDPQMPWDPHATI
jgi:hypothetical protein